MYEDKQFIAKIAISWYFFVEGAAMGNWAASIPIVKDEYNIDEGTLGNVLFAAAGGAVLAVPVVTFLSTWYGSKFTTLLGSMIMVLLFPIIGLNYNFYLLIIGAFLLGVGLLILDTSMNSQAVLLELAINQPILGHFHAVYAIGGLLGAIIGGIFFSLNFSLLLEFIIFSSMIIIPDIIFYFYLFTHYEEDDINRNAQMGKRSFLHDLASSLQKRGELHNTVENMPTPHVSSKDRIHYPNKPINDIHNPMVLESTLNSKLLVYDERKVAEATTSSASSSSKKLEPERSSLELEGPSIDLDAVDYYSMIIICTLLFVGYFGEGSIGDWSALYLTNIWDCSPLVATFGYVGFQTCVAIGRFFCDRIVTVVGRKKLLILAGITSGIGLSIAVLASFFPANTATLVMAILGFALCGAGLSALSPTVISLTGSGIDGFSSTSAMAIATAVGYLGILIGPPILGNLAEICGSLAWSFLLDSGLITSISAIVFLLPKKYHQMRTLSEQLESP